MENKKYRGMLAGVILAAIFAIGAIVPQTVYAGINDRGCWGSAEQICVGNDSSFRISTPIRMTADSSSLSAVEASTTIINTASYLVVTSSGGLVGLTTTPSISTTTAKGFALATGVKITLRGTSNSDAVELRDDDTLSGTQLELGAGTRALGINDVIVLMWDAEASTTGRWLEISYSALD